MSTGSQRAWSLRAFIEARGPGFARRFLARLARSDVGSRLARGMWWLSVGSVLSRGLMLVASVLVARILGQTRFGEFGVIQTTMVMFGTLAGVGLGLTATRYVAQFRVTDPARAGRVLVASEMFALATGGVMAGLLFVLSPWLASETIHAPHLAGPLRIGSVAVLISTLNGAQTGAMSGFEAFRQIARVNLHVGVLAMPFLVAGAWFGGLEGATWALVANLAVNWTLNHLAVRQEVRRLRIPISFRGWMAESPLLLRFALPAAIGGAIASPVNWAATAILVRQPGGYDEMAVFNAANQWVVILSFIPTMLGQVLLPVLADQMGRNQTAQARRVVTRAIQVNCLLIVPFAVAVGLLSPWIMGLYGPGFRGGWLTLALSSVTAVLMAVQTSPNRAAAAAGWMWTRCSLVLLWGGVYLLLSIPAARWGAAGMSAARLAAYVVETGVILYVAYAHVLPHARAAGDLGRILGAGAPEDAAC